MRVHRITIGLFLPLALSACGTSLDDPLPTWIQSGPIETTQMNPEDAYLVARRNMVDQQIVRRGVVDPEVLAAMGKVRRHEFVPDALRARAYDDGPLSIGLDQTISQPYVVAVMTELARIGQDSHVLEIGTGSGYQAAILGEIAAEVYSIEIVEELGLRAAATLTRLGYSNIEFRIGDGYVGWPEAAPFDAIIVTAAPPEVPRPLLDQLKIGGRLVVPVGRGFQTLEVHTRTAEGIERKQAFAVRFVPMTGRAQGPD